MPIIAIPVTDPERWPDPPTSGSWQRLENGSLVPADEATARSAGLWEDPPADPQPETAPEA